MMLSCNGIVKPVPKATDGHSWELRKNAQGIPFITDTVRQKWCMAIFQEAATSSQPKVFETADLPNLEVSVDDIKASESSQSHVAPVRAGLPGLTPTSGTLHALGNFVS